jgi:hypothetical protein
MPRSYLCTWGNFGGRRAGAGRRRRRGGRGELRNGVAAREGGHQGLASGGAMCWRVEVALEGGEVAAGQFAGVKRPAAGAHGGNREAGGGRRGPDCKYSKVQGAHCNA